MADRRVAKEMISKKLEKTQADITSSKRVFAGFEERECRCKGWVTLKKDSHDFWPSKCVAKV